MKVFLKRWSRIQWGARMRKRKAADSGRISGRNSDPRKQRGPWTWAATSTAKATLSRGYNIFFWVRYEWELRGAASGIGRASANVTAKAPQKGSLDTRALVTILLLPGCLNHGFLLYLPGLICKSQAVDWLGPLVTVPSSCVPDRRWNVFLSSNFYQYGRTLSNMYLLFM